MYEMRRAVQRRGLPELEELTDELVSSAKGYNFRSVYGYPTEVLSNIKANGNTKGLKGKPVISTTLLIDCDSDGDADTCRRQLETLGIKFTTYTTGNRGRHYHVPIEAMVGTDVIHSQITWLKNNNLWSVVDTSIYREGGMYRLEGATHSKTGFKKKKLEKKKK